MVHAKALESKLIGEEKSKSKQSNSFERLNKEGNRDKFRKLYHESENIHGKIYALVWFFDNDKNLYRRYKNELNQNEHVMIHHADVKLIYPLSDVFPLIESGYLKKHILYWMFNKSYFAIYYCNVRKAHIWESHLQRPLQKWSINEIWHLRVRQKIFN